MNAHKRSIFVQTVMPGVLQVKSKLVCARRSGLIANVARCAAASPSAFILNYNSAPIRITVARIFEYQFVSIILTPSFLGKGLLFTPHFTFVYIFFPRAYNILDPLNPTFP